MFKSSFLFVVLLATAGAASAQPRNTAIAVVNTRVTLGYGLHELGGSGLHADADPAYQLKGSYQGALFAAGELSYLDRSRSAGDELDHALDFNLKGGLPLTAAPALQITPYAVYGRAKFDFRAARLIQEEAGVGVLTQAQSGPFVFGLDLSRAQMLKASLRGQVPGIDVRGPLDKTSITTVRLEGDWNVTGAHHFWASYTMIDWAIRAERYDENVEQAQFLVGYSFNF